MIASAKSAGQEQPRLQESEPRATGDPPAEERAPHPLAPLLLHLAELWRQFQRCLMVQGDRARLQIRRAAVFMLLGFLFLAISLSVLMMAAVMFVLGITHGMTILLGGRAWLGELVTGSAVLFTIVLIIWSVLRQYDKNCFSKSIAKYEHDRKDRTAAV